MNTVTIALPDSLKKFVQRKMKTDGYGNVSEYFRTLVREAKEKEADQELEEQLLMGLQSGPDIPLTKTFWNDLRAEAGQLKRRRVKDA